MSTVIKDLGAVSAYAYAVEKGYTGTEAEFAELMADYAEVGQRAEDAAETATTKASEAATSATTATNKASEATTAAQTATTKAGEASQSASQAQTSAQTASTKASEASQSASTASAKATEATTAAETATTAKNDAVSAKTAAETAQGKAETAQGAAEDAAESVSASAAQIATNTSDISDLKEDLSDYTNTTYADLLMGKTPTASKYINGTTGEASTIADFCTYSLIDVEDLVGKVLYPRSDDSVVYNTAVSIAFYSSENETSEARTGGSGYSQALHNNGIKVPVDTKYMSVCFNSLRATEMYCGLNPDNINTYALNSQVKVNSSQIVNGDANKMANNIRFPAICFEFDDGHANDADIVDIFTAKGVTCAFALISNTTHANHLTYQNQGFEILSHSTDGTGMNNATVEESTIETKLKTSLEALEAEGFVVKGFVTPNTNMNSKFKPLLRKYYQFATTDMLGTYTGEQIPFMSPVNGIYNGFRVSLQTTTLEKQKEAVDKCIENYGCLVFSGHSAELDGSSYLTTTNLNELLTYINTQVSNGKCIIGNPSDVIIPYFATRNDDVSDGWISVTAEEADLDSRFTADRWAMSYNPKLKLFHFAVRLYPNQDITAQIYPLFKQPVPLVLSDLVMSELGRNCFMYDNGLLIEAGTAWTNGTKKRFSAMMRMR